MKILISDVNAHNRENLAGFLSTQGWHVVGQSASAQETLDLAVRHSADVVIADFNLDMPINQLTAALAATEKAPIVILLMTSHDIALAKKGLDAGAFACMAKNDGVDPILNTLEEIESLFIKGEKS